MWVLTSALKPRENFFKLCLGVNTSFFCENECVGDNRAYRVVDILVGKVATFSPPLLDRERHLNVVYLAVD